MLLCDGTALVKFILDGVDLFVHFMDAENMTLGRIV